VLEAFRQCTVTATQAADQLGLSRSRLYALSTAYLCARAKKQQQLWVPGASGAIMPNPGHSPFWTCLKNAWPAGRLVPTASPPPKSYACTPSNSIAPRSAAGPFANGLAHPVPTKRVRAPVRRWQRARIGELWQLDASPHRWFPGCKILFPMLNLLDDCSRPFTGSKLYERELLLSYFDFLPAAFLAHGRPLQLYVDYHGLFFTRDPDALTQLG
jgi:hypothetical protein